MRFSLRWMLVLVGLVALVFGLAWPLIEDRLHTVAIYSSERTVAGRLGWTEEPEAYYSTGNPIFICSEIYTEHVPHLNGENIPYLIVVRGAEKGFQFESGNGLDVNNLIASARFSTGQLEFQSTHCVHDQLVGPDAVSGGVRESLTINNREFDLTRGRVFCVNIIDDGYELNQHKISRIPADVFRTSHLEDRQRIRRVNAWWYSAGVD
ncbi:MAG: hypothetical protein AAF456_13335 [Planctomycetota bacterium]